MRESILILRDEVLILKVLWNTLKLMWNVIEGSDESSEKWVRLNSLSLLWRCWDWLRLIFDIRKNFFCNILNIKNDEYWTCLYLLSFFQCTFLLRNCILLKRNFLKMSSKSLEIKGSALNFTITLLKCNKSWMFSKTK